MKHQLNIYTYAGISFRVIHSSGTNTGNIIIRNERKSFSLILSIVFSIIFLYFADYLLSLYVTPVCC